MSCFCVCSVFSLGILDAIGPKMDSCRNNGFGARLRFYSITPQGGASEPRKLCHAGKLGVDGARVGASWHLRLLWIQLPADYSLRNVCHIRFVVFCHQEQKILDSQEFSHTKGPCRSRYPLKYFFFKVVHTICPVCVCAHARSDLVVVDWVHVSTHFSLSWLGCWGLSGPDLWLFTKTKKKVSDISLFIVVSCPYSK